MRSYNNFANVLIQFSGDFCVRDLVRLYVATIFEPIAHELYTYFRENAMRWSEFCYEVS